ncbi:MAG TPA: AraC family transcriptional regulator [Candidatus Binataceae bacterium]
MKNASDPTAEAHVVKFDDAEVFSAALKRVDLEVLQTATGAFRASYSSFTTGVCDAQVGSIKQPIFVRGASDPRRLGFLVELRKARGWSWFGQPMGDSSVGVCAGGSDLMIKAGRGSQWAFISAPPDSLVQCAQTAYGRELRPPRRGPAGIKPHPLEVAVIRGLLVESLSAIKAGSPDLPHVKHSIDRALCRMMVQMLLGEASEIRRAEIVRIQGVLKRVHYFMADHLGGAVSLEQLCQATGVDRETLLSVFRNCLGLDPVQFLKVSRLNQVHRALRRADPAIIAVADIARAWGFSNRRAFTREFTQWFGKSPTEVLRQPPRLL